MRKIGFEILIIVDFILSVLGVVADLFGIEQGLKEHDFSKWLSPVFAFFGRWWMVFLGSSIALVISWIVIRIYQKKEQKKKESKLPIWFNARKRSTNYVEPYNYLSRLKAFFLDKECGFSWWMISSVAGMGKTRIVLEALKDPRISNADIQWLEDYRDYKEQALFERIDNMMLSKNMRHIILAEDAQINMRSIGKLITYIGKKLLESNQNHTFKLLLLVRTDENDNSEKRYNQLASAGNRNDIENVYRYKKDTDELKVNKYPEDTICNIVKSYVSTTLKARNNHQLSDDEMDNLKKKVLEILKSDKIDPNHLRPLFAIFIADSILDKQDPTNWDKEKILNYVTDARYSELLKMELQGLQRDINPFLYEKVESILCLAILRNGIKIDELGEIRKKIEEDLKSARTGLSNAEQLFTELQMFEKDRSIRLNIPDILSEYYIYKKLVVETKDDTNYKRISWISSMLDGFLEEASQIRQKVVQDFEYLYKKDQIEIRNFYRLFLGNCNEVQLMNITDILRGGYNEIYFSDKIILEEMTKAVVNSKNDAVIKSYAAFLAYEMNNGYLNINKSCTDQMGVLGHGLSDRDLIKRYCQGLADLVEKDIDIEMRRTYVEKLEKESIDNSDDQEIANSYCRGLLQLLYSEVDINRKRSCLANLEDVSKKYSKMPRIVLFYCKGLAELSDIDPVMENKHRYVEKLGIWNKKFEQDIEIVKSYCQGLVNLTYFDHNIDVRRDCIAKLEEERIKHATEAAIVLKYCWGLVNLVDKDSNISFKRGCLLKLEKESNIFSDDLEIVNAYCEGLFNLLNDDDDFEAKCNYLRKLEEVCRSHHYPYNNVFEYCKALYVMRSVDSDNYDHYMMELGAFFSDKKFVEYALQKNPTLRFLIQELKMFHASKMVFL